VAVQQNQAQVAIQQISLSGHTTDRPRWPYRRRIRPGGRTAETSDLAYLATEQLAREPIKKRPDWSGIQSNVKHMAVRS